MPTIPFTAAGPPAWGGLPPGPVPPGDRYRAWVELAAAADIAAAGWGGAAWVPPPPAWPAIPALGLPAGNGDEGYSAAAVGFAVVRVGIWMQANPGTDFVFTVFDPTGALVATIAPTGPGLTWSTPLPAPTSNRRGIWEVTIDRAGASSVANPGLYGTPGQPPFNPVREPFVGPYNSPQEGILGVLFDGNEITTPPPPPPPPPTGCWTDVQLTIPAQIPCAQSGGAVTLTFSASVTPAAPPYTGPYLWEVKNMTTGAVLQPYTSGGSTFSFTFPGPADYRVRVKVPQPNCPEGDLIDADTFTVPPCTPCAISVSGPTQTPCTDGPPTAPQTFTATTSTPFSGAYTWEVRDTTAPATSPPLHQSTGTSTFSFAFPAPASNQGQRIYKVTVSIQTQPPCQNPTAADSWFITVPRCTPPPPPPTVPPPTVPPPTVPPPTVPPPTVPPPTVPPPTVPPPTVPPPPPPPNGPFSLCCLLVGAWGILFLVTATLLFFSYWLAAGIVGFFFLLALAIWIGVCCWPCARTFWRCCVLLQWFFVWGVLTTSLLFAIYALFKAGNGWVVFGYGLFVALIGILMGFARCGRPPNPFDPSTWPPCRCPP